MCGYALPSVLLYFGTMAILGVLLQSFFVGSRPQPLSAPDSAFDQSPAAYPAEPRMLVSVSQSSLR
jgi:hypothetical protein